MIRVTSRPRPFELGRVQIEIPEGATLADIVEHAVPDRQLRPCAVVQLGAERIDRAVWHRVRPRSGTLVAVTVVPGDSTVLRTVLTVAVLVVAAIVVPYATPALGSVGASVLGAGIVAGGMLAINTLIPAQQPTQSDVAAPQSHVVSGTRNSLKPWDRVPLILGRHRFTPPLAGAQIPLPRGADQDLAALFCWGYGGLLIENLSVGDTPLSSYADVTTATFDGTPGQTPNLDLYPSSVHVEQIATELRESYGRISRATPADTDEAVAEIVFPKGLIGYGKKTGDKLDQRVDITVSYRAAGSGGSWTDAGTTTVTATTTDAIRRGITITFPSRGRWEVGVRRASPNSNEERKISDSWWSTLRSVTKTAPVALPGVAVTAVKIRAGDQIAGALDELRGTCTTKCLDWDTGSSAWVYRPTNNPASLFRWLLQHPSRRKPAADGRIDLDALADWHVFCGERGYTCNLIVDQRTSLDETLRTIAACGRALPIRVDGRWSVAIDGPKAYPVQLFTPRNSRGFRAKRLFLPTPDALRVQFVDETNNWEESERVVYMDGVDPATARRIEDLALPGITDPDIVHAMARFRLAEIEHRAETWELETDFEHLACQRGDRVQIQHEVILSGIGSGRVMELITDGGGDVTAIRLDEIITLENHVCILRCRRSDLSMIELRLGDEGGATDTLPLATPADPADCPAVGDLVAVFDVDLLLEDGLVIAIEPAAELSAKLTLVPYRDAVYSADFEEIPRYEPRITSRYGQAPIITGIRSDDRVAQRDADGSIHVRAVASIFDDGTRPLSRLLGIELGWYVEGASGSDQLISAPAAATEIAILGVEPGQTIRVSARWVYRDGTVGVWSGEIPHQVIGPSLPPPDVTLVWAGSDAVEWEYRFPPRDLAGFRLRFSETAGTSWEDALPLTDAPITAQRVDFAELSPATVEVLVRAEATSGLLSTNVGRLALSIADLMRRYRWAVSDLAAEAWPGQLYGPDLLDGDLVAPDTSTWLDPPDGIWLDPPDGLWLQGIYASWGYRTSWICPPTATTADTIRIETTGDGRRSLRWRWQPGPNETAADDDSLYADVLNKARGALVYYAKDPNLPFYRQIDELEVAALFGDIAPELDEERVFGAGLQNVPWYELLDPTLRSAWLPYRGAIRPRPGHTLELRVYAAGGVPRSTLSSLRLFVDSPERRQVMESRDLVGDTGDGIDLGLPTGWREVRWVHALLQQPTTAVQIRTINKSPPIVTALDAAGTPVDARADITLGGY